jgi:hypothetical protein
MLNMAIKCPVCGEAERRIKLPQRGNHSFGLYLLGGFIGGLFWALAQENKYECGRCKQIFFSHTRASRVFAILSFIVYALVAICFVYFIWMAVSPPLKFK